MKNAIQPRRRRRRAHSMLALAAAAGVAGIGSPALGLVIDPTFSSSIKNLSNAAQVEAAINYVDSQFDEIYSNNATVNITFEASNSTSFLGETSPSLSSTTYPALQKAFVADAAATGNASQMTAAADDWPATDPTGSASDWFGPSAELKAMGLLSSNTANDATVTFSFNSEFPYSFDPLDRAESGTFDFIGIAEHEIAHGLGREGLMGESVGRHDAFTPLDLYRFTSAGTLSLKNTSGVYYSIDGGATNLKNFASSSDDSDWDNSGPNGYVPDSFNALSEGAIANTLTPVDITEMAGLGYNLNPTNLTWGGAGADFLTGNGWSNSGESSVNPYHGANLVVTSGSPSHTFTSGESFDLSDSVSDMGESLTVSGGSVSLNGNVNVGGNSSGAGGNGALTVSGTGVLTVGGTLTVFNSGTTALNLSGGTLNLGALNLNGDNALLNWTGGTLNFTNGLTIGSGGPFGSTLAITPGQTLGVTSAGALNLQGTLTISGGTLNAVTVNNTGGYMQTGGTATVGQFIGSGSVTVTGGKTTLSPSGGMSQVGSLVMAITSPAQLDITNNVLAVNFASPSTDPVLTIRSYLQSGYNGDTWTGPGIVSANAASNPGLYAVGYADGNVDAGTPAGANQILIENTLAGDANLDGTVNFADLLVVAQNFNHTLDTHGNPIDWADGDFNYDGNVNFADLLLVAQNFNKQLGAGQLAQLPGSFTAAWDLALADVQASESDNVPEPLSISFLAVVAGATLMRRRRSTRAGLPKLS